MKLLIILLFGVSFVVSQEKVTPNYQLASKFSGKKVSKMVHSTSVSPHWLKHSNRFWYTYKTGEGTKYYLVNPDSRKKQLLFDNAKMAMDLTRIVGDPYDAKHLPIKKIRFIKKDKYIEFDVTSSQYEKEVKNPNDSTKVKKKKKKKKKKKVFHFEYNISSKKLNWIKDYKKEKKKPRWASISPDEKTVIFSRHHNLFMMDRENYEKALEDDKDSTIVETQLTWDGEEFFAYGGSRWGKDNKKLEKEKDDRKGAWITWSPNSKKFAISRSDTRHLDDFWVINSLSKPRPTLETYKYTMPGESKYRKNEINIFDITKDSAENRMKLDIDKFTDQYVSVLRAPRLAKNRDDKHQPSIWLSPKSSEVYFVRRSRDMKKHEVCLANLNTGKINVVIKDSMNTYIEVRDLALVNKGKELIYWSEKDGWAHLYLYDSKGKLKRQITRGAFHVNRVVGVDSENRVVYFTANGREKGEDPYYEHLYKINLNGSGLRLLNKGNFNHRVSINDNQKYFVNNYSRVNTAPKSALYSTNGSKLLDLEETNLDRLMESGYKFPEPFKVKSEDGITDIYGVMYKPFDFDPKKKYPIITYVYPGPQTEAVNKSFSSRMSRTDRVAQLGFIVISVGNRGGHPARSKWYHNYGYGNLRDYGLADKKAAIEQLADRHPFINSNKVGIFGHSGGGFMSTAAMLVYPDFFKAAVSSAGNHDNSIYNNWWSEKHHGVEEVVKNGKTTFKYAVDKNSDIAKNLKGHLLLATGDMDNNVNPAGTIGVANALIKANKRFEYVVLPGKRHGFGNYNEYFFWKLADHFTTYLLGENHLPVDILEINRDIPQKR